MRYLTGDSPLLVTYKVESLTKLIDSCPVFCQALDLRCYDKKKNTTFNQICPNKDKEGNTYWVGSVFVKVDLGKWVFISGLGITRSARISVVGDCGWVVAT